MVGQGVLRECLLDADVESVLCITRSPIAQQHEKLRVLVHGDFTNFSAIEGDGYRRLEEGQQVEFEVGAGRRGEQARRVRVLVGS